MKLPGKKFSSRLEKSIKHAVPESASNSGQDTFLTPFALALGAGNFEVGLVNSIPILFKILTQPFAGGVVEKHMNRKTVVLFSMMTNLLWIPLALIPFLFATNQIFWLIVFLSIGGIFMSLYDNSWVTWTSKIVPEKIRGEFFAKRNMYIKLSTFLATLILGWVIGLFNTIEGFMVIFGITVVLGLFSDLLLSRIPYPKERARKHKKHKTLTKFKFFISTFTKHKNFSRFIIYKIGFNFTQFIIFPFVIVYMLSVLKIGYGWYAIVAAAAAATAILSNQYWGRILDRFGDRRILYITSIMAVATPLLWAFSTEIWHIMLASLFSGFVWSGLQLSQFNYLLDVTPPKHRPIYLASHKMITFIPIFLAPLVGGYLAQEFESIVFLSLTGLPLLFLLTGVLRMASLLPLTLLRETRIHGKRVPAKNIFWKVAAIYPAKGILHEVHVIERKIIRR